MSTSPHQLFLLADHLKLSLLERQRAASLKIESTKQDGHITRSLETLRQGLEGLRRQQFDQEAAGEDTSDLVDQIQRLQSQYDDLSSQFQTANASPSTSSSLTKPNDPSLSPDFSAATTRPTRTPQPRSSSLRKKAQSQSPNPNKSVRFHDTPSAADADADDAAESANRAALFDNRPYRDDPSSTSQGYADEPELSNQQIHAYHKNVLRDQDDQLDSLGQSVRRQRDLSIQMGTELDEQGVLLHDIEDGVDRHQGTLDRARNRLGRVSRGAKDNWSWVTIGVLMMLLILLIVLLKT